MERNVHSFRVAIKKGYSPCLYSYDATQIPLGEFEARLDFKTWSKRIIAINCFFTKIDTGNMFVVTVYCNYRTGKYDVPGSTVDFSNCPLNENYRIAIGKNTKGNIVLLKAEAIALSPFTK
jgi:hypothetical protein